MINPIIQENIIINLQPTVQDFRPAPTFSCIFQPADGILMPV